MNQKKDTLLESFVNVVKDMASNLVDLMNDDLIDSTMPAPIMAQAINQRKSSQLKPTFAYNYNNTKK